MSEPEKTAEKYTAPVAPNLPKGVETILVERIWFVHALDTPARQISNAECSPAIKQHGESWVCRFIPAWSCFEMVCGRNGAIASVDYLPATAIKSWKRAV